MKNKKYWTKDILWTLHVIYSSCGSCGCDINNERLGTGQGYSVLELVHAFERVNGVKVKYEIKPRRAGDIATCYADPTRAKEELGWVATRGIDEMCRDTWNFAKTRMK